MNGSGARRGRPLEVDLTDCVIGGVHVIGRAPNRSNHIYWACQCFCGDYFECQTFDLMMGKVRSCGCLRKDIARRRNQSQRN